MGGDQKGKGVAGEPSRVPCVLCAVVIQGVCGDVTASHDSIPVQFDVLRFTILGNTGVT